MANSVDPDQTAPIGAVCSGSKLFASILNSSVMLGNFLQQTTSADNIFRCIFLGALRVKSVKDHQKDTSKSRSHNKTKINPQPGGRGRQVFSFT